MTELPFDSPYKEIADTIEVDGDSVGRIKDIDLAHGIANNANYYEVKKDKHAPGYESRESMEERDAMIEYNLRIALAERAIKNQLWYSVNPMAGQIVGKGKLTDEDKWKEVAIDQFTDLAPKQAKESLSAYDSVVQKARRQNRRKD